MENSRLEAFVGALESHVAEHGELILNEMYWNLDGSPPEQDLSDPWVGTTPEFLGIVNSLCGNHLEWLQLYVDLLTGLADPDGEVRTRLDPIADKLWMKTRYGELVIWHVAFPALDGGGSNQARAFHQLVRDRYPKRTFKVCFEWCCGPGFLGFSALSEGICEELVLADINPNIVPGIERTIRENELTGRVRYYLSDNLKAIPSEERFDLVLGNPPWAYREIPDLPNPLIPNDPNWDIHREFFAEIDGYLRPEAELLVSCYEPFKSVAYIPEQKEPWDERPQPPIEEFRGFMSAGGLSLEQVVPATPDPFVSLGSGMMFLVGRRAAEVKPRPSLDLIGVGGIPEGEELPAPFEFDLNLFKALDLPGLFQGYQRWQALQAAVQSNLAKKPLTEVLGTLFEGPSVADSALLAQLGIPESVWRAFPDWGESAQAEFQESGIRLSAEGPHQEVKTVRLQVSQDAPVGVALRTLRLLLECLPEGPDFVLSVKPGASERHIREFFGEQASRVRVWEQPHQTLFAQDNAKAASTAEGPVLLAPGGMSPHRPADVMMSAPLPLCRSSFHWEGGNLLFDGHQVLVGANSVVSSMRALGLTEAQVIEGMSCEMGAPVAVLGSTLEAVARITRCERGGATTHAVDGGQADFHIDLDCCLLSSVDEKIAALASPELGLQFVDGVLTNNKLFDGHFLEPQEARRYYLQQLEYSVTRRSDLLEGYRKTLEGLGYRVIQIPDLRLVSDHNYLARSNFNFGYLNGFGLKVGQTPTLCLLSFGMSELEQFVAAAYRSVGVEVMWVGDSELANDLAGMRGGLHCFCSVLQ